MASSPWLNIIESARVSPSTDSPHDSVDWLTLPLTFFDMLWLKFHPVERVFFYRLTESTRQYFDSVIIPRLKFSLSLALRHYLPLAGRLVWDVRESKSCIRYSRNGDVLFTVVESETDFSSLSGNEQRLANELHPLVPELPVSDDEASIIALQITLFPNQGFCIGLSAHHAVLDGKTTTMFVKAWAHICKQEQEQEEEHENRCLPYLPQDLTPCFDRTVIKDTTGLEEKLFNAWQSLSNNEDNKRSLKPMPKPEVGTDLVRMTFELTRESVERLRERVKNELSQEYSSKELHLSAFVITFAYVFTCMVKARGGDRDRSVGFGFPADCRNRLNPPVQATYFGNCVTSACKFDVKAGVFLEENGFIRAVKMVSDSVKGLDSVSVEKPLHELLDSFRHMQSSTQIGSVAGSTRLGVYGSDFGWGKPVKVEIVSIDLNQAMALAESRDGTGGVEIGLSLKKHEMEAVASLFTNGLNNL